MTKATCVINACYERTGYIELQEAKKHDDETFIGGTIKAYETPINRSLGIPFRNSRKTLAIVCNEFQARE